MKTDFCKLLRDFKVTLVMIFQNIKFLNAEENYLYFYVFLQTV